MIPMERYCWGKPSFSASVSLTLAMVWVASTLAGIKSPVIMSPPLFLGAGATPARRMAQGRERADVGIGPYDLPPI